MNGERIERGTRRFVVQVPERSRLRLEGNAKSWVLIGTPGKWWTTAHPYNSISLVYGKIVEVLLHVIIR